MERILPYEIVDLQLGLTYLGYFLKPNAYLVGDWLWLVKKVENRIKCWQNRKLSMGGRLILLNSVLSSLPFYWFSMAIVPLTIFHMIRKMLFNFLWRGLSNYQGCHLVLWDIISRPILYGGWGVRNLYVVHKALHMKSLWRALFDGGLWGKLIRDKYICPESIAGWLCSGKYLKQNSSVLWAGLVKLVPYIRRWLNWQVGNGYQVIIGRDCILGHPQPVLNADTIQILNAMGIQFLNQVFMPTADSEHGGFWLSATTLALNGRVADEWDLFISGLRHAGTCLTSELDRLCWDFAIGDGTVTTYQAYSALIFESGIINASWWTKRLWDWHIPVKIKLFVWFALHYRIYTGDRFRLHGGIGPSLLFMF